VSRPRTGRENGRLRHFCRLTRTGRFPARTFRPIRFLFFVLPIGLLSGEEIASHPFEGVTRIRRTGSQPRPARMHLVLIDFGRAPDSLRLTPPSGARETTRQTTLDFLKEQRAQIAINTSLFLTRPQTAKPSWWGAASDGNVYSGFEAPEQSVEHAFRFGADRDCGAQDNSRL
jgi:hypothetical protein